MRVGWSRTEDVADCSIGAVCHLVRSGFLRQQHASGSHQTNHPSPPARERKMIRARRLQVLYCTGRTFICANSCMSCSYTPSPFSARHAEASSSCPSCPHIAIARTPAAACRQGCRGGCPEAAGGQCHPTLRAICEDRRKWARLYLGVQIAYPRRRWHRGRTGFAEPAPCGTSRRTRSITGAGGIVSTSS